MVTRRVSEVELDSVQSSLTRRVSNLVTASQREQVKLASEILGTGSTR